MLGSTHSDEELEVQYFQDTIDDYKQLGVRKMPREMWTKEDLASQIGLDADQFYLICRSKKMDLKDLRVCYEMDEEGRRPTKCWDPRPDNCEGDNDEIWLKGWQ